MSQRAAHGCGAFTSKDSATNRPDGDPARPHIPFRAGDVCAPEFAPGSQCGARRGRPSLSESESSPSLRIPSPESSPSRIRVRVRVRIRVRNPSPNPISNRVGSALSSPRRHLVVRASSRRLIVKDGDMFAIEERMVAFTNAGGGTRRRRGRASRPGVRVQTEPHGPRMRRGTASITSLRSRSASRFVRVARRGGSAGAVLRFSGLVHAVLATVPSIRPNRWCSGTAETQGRLLMALGRGGPGAAVVVTSVLRDALIARALAGAAIRRESPNYRAEKERHDDRGCAGPCVRGERRHRGRRLQNGPRTGRR